MLANVFDMLFGCWHKNYSFPITAKRDSSTAGTKGTYVVCLDCGKEFPYDWNKMKMLSSEPEHSTSVPLTVGQVSGFGKVA
jgi:hypothetical protein